MQRIGSARKARLSIPKVNQRPRISQRRAAGPSAKRQMGLANRIAAPPAPRPDATGTAQPSNASVPETQSQPTDPFKAAASSSAPRPPVPGDLFQVPAWSGQGEDPRDATYWSNLAKLKFNAEQEYASSLAEQTRADSDYNEAVQTAIRNRASQQRGLGESAIRANLGNSGWLDSNEAQDTLAYTQERAAAQLSKTQEDAARAAARKAIQQGFSLEVAAELGEAAARSAERREQEAAEAEGLPGEAADSPSGGAAAAPPGRSGGPFWGPKGPGGYMPKPKRVAVAPARPVMRAALSRARRAR
jgi:hypothetical protein